jgi:hypothetical protein
MELIAEGIVSWRTRRLQIELIVASLIAMPTALLVAIYLGQPSWLSALQRCHLSPARYWPIEACSAVTRRHEHPHLRLVKVSSEPKDGLPDGKMAEFELRIHYRFICAVVYAADAANVKSFLGFTSESNPDRQ